MAHRWRLDGKLALVTGGTKGIGLAVVEELALLGASVLTCARNEEEIARFNKRFKEEESGKQSVKAVRADVSSKGGRETLFKELARFGEEVLGRGQDAALLDILVNNVGTNVRKPTAAFTDEDVEFLWKTNQESCLFLCQKAYNRYW